MKAFPDLALASLLGAFFLAPVFASPASPNATMEKLGTVHFAVRGQPAAQTQVVRGVKLLHHMMYEEADQAFAQAAALDPDCALAYWGRAMTLIHPLWPDAPTEADRAKGAEFIARGVACPNLPPRERDYLSTLNHFFRIDAPSDYPARLKTLDEAWADLAEKYPEDLDASAFAALYHLAPARFLPKDKSNRLQIEAATRLQAIAQKIPDHPGAQHYKIHAYDFPLLADRALEVCATYGGIAPDVPHALHMPTHIYTRRGLWAESIDYNRRSAEAGRKLVAAAGGTMNSHVPHALDYLAYALLQRGQYRAAADVRRESEALHGPYAPGGLTQIAFAVAAIPARCALERQAWDEAAALPLRRPADFPWSEKFLHCESIVRFARAIGAVRSGRLDAARAELGEQERILAGLTKTNGVSYWASQAETHLLATRAWLAWAEQQPDNAVALMRRAVELEAATDKEAVTPGEVLPAGDLLGDLLLELGRPAEALAAYEAVLAASPNRLNTLYGAGLAAERAGDAGKARHYYEQLVRVAREADPGLARVVHAQNFLQQSSTTIAANARSR
ncbi:MAG: hypothetical protein C0518_11065 [Opitutus sp.]|nr:hypothetical protein [Opitutus sp.]